MPHEIKIVEASITFNIQRSYMRLYLYSVLMSISTERILLYISFTYIVKESVIFLSCGKKK